MSNFMKLLFERKERKGRNKQKNKRCQPERSAVKKINLGEVNRSDRGRSEKAALDEVVKCEWSQGGHGIPGRRDSYCEGTKKYNGRPCD